MVDMSAEIGHCELSGRRARKADGASLMLIVIAGGWFLVAAAGLWTVSSPRRVERIVESRRQQGLPASYRQQRLAIFVIGIAALASGLATVIWSYLRQVQTLLDSV